MVRLHQALTALAVRARPTSFIGEVHQAVRRAGGNPNRLAGTGRGSGRFNARGRGAAAALTLKGRSAWGRDGSGTRTRARRVAVKARVVKLNPQSGATRGRQFVSANAVDAHLRYLERDGVTRDGEKGRVYSAERDVEDGRSFVERGREDRHQFRFIVSAEDGVELSDPRETARDLMKQMEADLGTKLDWIAVDHHNTGHPHTHIIVCGVTDDGKTLNIAGDYIAHGIRERASEIVTPELGRQTEQEVTRSVEREGLAEDRHPSRYVLHREKATERIIGRVLDKGLGGDEMGERVRLVIDGVDGRVHHVELDASRAVEIGRGMIVAAGSGPSGPRAADRNIMDIAGTQGIYRPSAHLERARAAIERIGGDPEAFVRSHVRRLEALRRAGHVERIDADHWRVPADLPERGQAYDLARDGANIRVSILSPIGLDQQIGHEGATWLDRELVSRQRAVLSEEGFGQEVKAALDKRKQMLVDRGHVTDLGDGHIRAPKDLIQRLEGADIERAGKALAAERGRTWQPAVPGNYVSGQLVGSTQLPSGRFATIDDGLGFSLVPWRPALEQRIGRHISGVAMPGGGVDWSFGRKLGLGL